MSTNTPEKQLWRRIEGLYATDPQFADARPDDEITAATCRPGLRLPHIVATLDYTVIDVAVIPLGAVSVPPQGSAQVTQLRPIVAETEPGHTGLWPEEPRH